MNPTLLLGLVLAGALAFGPWYYRSLPPQRRAGLVRRAAAMLTYFVSIGLALRGQLLWAVPLAAFGYLVLWRGSRLGLATDHLAGASRVSSVRTAFLEMMLDQATGALSGHVLAGTYAGRDLGGLSRTELGQLWRECRAGEAQSRQLLEAYLERRWPEWRAEMPRPNAGGSANDAGNGAGAQTGRLRAPMTRDEAFEVLGLPPNAAPDDIKAAHRNLMKRLHPDQGGTNYLAAKINEAKDILVGKRP
jgi:DnaJ domain